MVEMYMRSLERPSFEWRFKGAMAFHNEFAANGVQYIDSISQKVLEELTSTFAETEAESQEIKIELNKKSRKGCGAFRVEMMIYHKEEPLPTPEETKPKVPGKRGRPRGSVSAASSLLGTSAKRAKFVEENKDCSLITVKPVNLKLENLEQQDTFESAPKQKSHYEGPTIASMLEKSLGGTDDENANKSPSTVSGIVCSGVDWSAEMVNNLIQYVKEFPALWHHKHPHYRNIIMRSNYLSQIAKKLRELPGGAWVNEDDVFKKWSSLRDSFQLFSEANQEERNSWEYYKRLMFLTPEVMSACRFDGEGAVAASSANISLDLQSQINKLFGFTPMLNNGKDIENATDKLKLEHNCNSQNSVKTHIELDSTPHVQQVVSTWVPPREDAVGSLQPFSSTPPTATAQVTVKNDIAHILQNSLPRPSLSNSEIQFGDLLQAASVRPYEDKWSLMGRMIEETARELETKNSELAYRLQKEINDVIFKYQLESVKQK
ncbi:hypothetical protein OESDEN_10365 [Oesophagostomum dentatum]|uniref:MADF domain-containing protein n=1 Tax=Oesophagostomum dentatum TaxID=61180 RepID=A0A0B1T0X5_OESDE|nr:hypothetical protein OESDEN_10365 [Oesophagostomum dentatum]